MVTSKLKVSESKKRSSPEPVEPIPGTICSNCEQTICEPTGNWHSSYQKWEKVPHDNPMDCIRFLKSEIDSIRDNFRELRSEMMDKIGDGWAIK